VDKENVPQKKQLNNPLHGLKLITILEVLVESQGWEKLAQKN
jgi:uncharacterized protein (DUF2132 family)